MTGCDDSSAMLERRREALEWVFILSDPHVSGEYWDRFISWSAVPLNGEAFDAAADFLQLIEDMHAE
jgi:ferric-dicitrate binding protein FerR (iron transport regulator)